MSRSTRRGGTRLALLAALFGAAAVILRARRREVWHTLED